MKKPTKGHKKTFADLTRAEQIDMLNYWNTKRKNTKVVDRTGHPVRMLMTLEECSQKWIDSGQLHNRGLRKGQYCLSRHDDLGDYTVDNCVVELTSVNAARAKLNRPVSQATKDKMSKTRKGVTFTQEHKDAISEAASKLDKSPCEHCGALHTNAHLARFHGPRCKHAPK